MAAPPAAARTGPARAAGPAGTTAGGGTTAASGMGPVGGAGWPAGGRLGRFEVRRVVGRGGMGTVFAARDPALNREVAVKVPSLAGLPAPAAAAARRRFLREARAAAAVRHPHLVAIFEAGELPPDPAETAGVPGAEPVCYLACELCEGPDLARWLGERTEPVPPRLAAAVVAPLADAVDRCHAAGVVHRDLKPANVLLFPNPGGGANRGGGEDAAELPFTPKVADFGVAAAADAAATATASRVVGTPLYMAPEQAAGQTAAVGPATDVYALGVILYELLAGRPPHAAATTAGLLRKIEEGPPSCPRSHAPAVPPALAAVAMRCLRTRPADRYASAAELAADLRRFLAGRPVAARPWGAGDALAAWLRRPNRVRDAGLVAVVWNAALASCLAALSAGAAFGWKTPLPPASGLAAEAGGVAAAHYALAGVGVLILRGSRWAWRAGFAAAAACCGVAWNGALGGGGVFSMYDTMPEAKYLMLVSLAAAFTAQFAVFLLSVRAELPVGPAD